MVGTSNQSVPEIAIEFLVMALQTHVFELFQLEINETTGTQ